MLVNFLVLLIIGLIIGYVASRIMGDQGLGLIWCVVLGLLGSILGGWLAHLVGISAHGLVAQLIVGVVGACLLIFIAGKLKR